MPLTIRSAIAPDSRAIQHIYAQEVFHGLATFDEIPPTVKETEAKLSQILNLGLPFYVAVMEGKLIGFAYAQPYRQRPAYRHTLESSVYVAPDYQRKGVGKALLSAVIGACSQARQIIAVIGDSQNRASIALHRALGFQDSGVLKSVGWKHQRWIDTVLMQKTINDGDQRPATTNLAGQSAPI